MAKAIKRCRVCGKDFEACHTQRPNMNNEFRWNEICCSEECGMKYLAAVLASRGQAVEEPAAENDIAENEEAEAEE